MDWMRKSKKGSLLHDVWVDLCGEEFADKNVKEESVRRGFYDYLETGFEYE